MLTPVPDLIASLTALGGESAAAEHARFAADLDALLATPPELVTDRETFRAALAHGFSYYYWRWDQRAADRRVPVETAIEHWAARPDLDMDLLCELLDFHYFVAWCFTDSSTEQCRLAMRGMRLASEAFARAARPPAELPPPGTTVHVLWLAMFASASDPMSVALRHIAPALLTSGGRFRLSVIAWRQTAPEFLDWLRSLGVTCHVPEAATPSTMIAAIEALAAADPPSIAISDMNNAVPTALFARRLAPAQIFLQAGMPAWPVQPLHGVFNSFGFDPETAGWGNARMLAFNPPWDMAKLNPPDNTEEVAAQRALLPDGLRLIGNYGRVVKLTEPCLVAAERILLQCPDVAFVTGGTGDSTAVRAFIARSPVGDRMRIVEGFVPGQSWGRLLDVFLDTWPVTGGESCREVIAKGGVVVTMHSAEMPAIDRQRDPSLVARDWDTYVAMSVRLLRDPAAYAAARTRARDLAQAMTNRAAFTARLTADLGAVLKDVSPARRSMRVVGDAPDAWPGLMAPLVAT